MVRRVLIVEDSEELLEVAATILRGAGYEVGTRKTGPSALATILAHPPDLLLLDVMLPAMSGFEILQTLREDRRTKDLKVIMVTSLNKPFDQEKAKALQVVEYIQKPYHPATLLARVKAHAPLN